MATTAKARIEQLAQRPESLSIVAGWIYNEWWAAVAEETAESLAGRPSAHLTPDQIPLTLVASLENRPIGTVTIVDHDVGTQQWPERSPWLAALYVVPQCRHRGIGTGLVNEAGAKATELGVEMLFLLTAGREAFYARLGWKITESLGGKVVMSKRTGRVIR